MAQATDRAALWSLAAGNLAVGTGSLVVAGLLPGMALDLGRTESVTGQTLTAFAVAVALGGPLLATPTSRMDRRKVLVVGLLLFALASLMAAAAPNLEWLIAARFLGGLGACVTTPVAAATAAMLAAPEHRGRAMGFVFAGFTAAAVVGIPLGAWVGAAVGWRVTLAGVGVFALFAALAVGRTLPSGLYGQPINRMAWRNLSKSPHLMLIVCVTGLQALGQFVLFGFVAPALVEQINADARMISLLFFVTGAAGLIGTLAMSRLIDRFGPPSMVHLAIGSAQAAFLLWPMGQESLLVTAALMALWGSASFTINGAQQARLMLEAPELASATLPLNTSAIYIGQACGTMLGGLVLARFGAYWLAPVGGVILAFALSLSIIAAAQREGALSRS